mgnify:CR=1 FL=1
MNTRDALAAGLHRARQRTLELTDLDDAALRALAARHAAALEDMSRGTVVDEPASTKRAGLDQARRDRELALLPKPKVDKPRPVAPPPKEKIVKKWYFWVTLLAIAASGAAITAFAADPDASMDDVAKAAGVVRRTVYAHFDSREALINGIVVDSC